MRTVYIQKGIMTQNIIVGVIFSFVAFVALYAEAVELTGLINCFDWPLLCSGLFILTWLAFVAVYIMIIFMYPKD